MTEKKKAKAKKKAAKKTVGRQPIYTLKLHEKIIDLVYLGKSGREISKLEGMPHYNTMVRWKRKYPKFAEDWLKGWQEAAYEGEEECKDIADTVDEDKAAIQKAKLRIEVRQKSIAARMPSIYGNKIDLTVDDKVLTPDERRARLAAAIKKAEDLG